MEISNNKIEQIIKLFALSFDPTIFGWGKQIIIVGNIRIVNNKTEVIDKIVSFRL